jgi:dipeptidyl aminopeptidase/acylaminoacyl peptidase
VVKGRRKIIAHRVEDQVRSSRSATHCLRDLRWLIGSLFSAPITLGMLVSGRRQSALRPETLSDAVGIYDFTWSPDSKSLAYVGPAGGGFDIWTISSAGGDQPRRVTSTLRYKTKPRWSGDRKWIAFITVGDDGNADLRAVSIDGQSVLTLTDTAAEESDPVWSPDSTRIAFTQRIGAQATSRAWIFSQRDPQLADGPASGLR